MTSPSPLVIGLCGDIGAGKSTVAKFLEARGFTRSLGFANKLKLVLLDVYGPLGMERRHLFGTQADKNEPLPGILGPDGQPQSGRGLAEHIGTRGFREACPDTWAKYLFATWAAWPGDAGMVIEDVRFQNEINVIRDFGGEIWHVSRIGGPPTEFRNHPSDTEWRGAEVDDHVSASYGAMSDIERKTDIALARARERAAHNTRKV